MDEFADNSFRLMRQDAGPGGFKNAENYFVRLRRGGVEAVEQCLNVLTRHEDARIMMLAAQTLAHITTYQSLHPNQVAILIRQAIQVHAKNMRPVYIQICLSISKAFLNSILSTLSHHSPIYSLHQQASQLLKFGVEIPSLLWIDIITNVPEILQMKEFGKVFKTPTSPREAFSSFLNKFLLMNIPLVIADVNNFVRNHGMNLPMFSLILEPRFQVLDCSTQWISVYASSMANGAKRLQLYEAWTSASSIIQPSLFTCVMNFLQFSSSHTTLSKAAATVNCTAAHYSKCVERCESFLQALCTLGVPTPDMSVVNTPMDVDVNMGLKLSSKQQYGTNGGNLNESIVITMSREQLEMADVVISQMVPLLGSLLSEVIVYSSPQSSAGSLDTNDEEVDIDNNSMAMNLLQTVSIILEPLLRTTNVAYFRDSAETLNKHPNASQRHQDLWGFALNNILQLLRNCVNELLSRLAHVANSPQNYEKYITLTKDLFNSTISLFTHVGTLCLEKQQSSLNRMIWTGLTDILGMLVRTSIVPSFLSQPSRSILLYFARDQTAFDDSFQSFSDFRNSFRDHVREICQCSNRLTHWVITQTLQSIESFGRNTNNRTLAEAASMNASLLVESWMHACSSLSKQILQDLASSANYQFDVSLIDLIAKFLYSLSQPWVISLRSFCRLAAVMLADIYPTFFKIISNDSLLHNRIFTHEVTSSTSSSLSSKSLGGSDKIEILYNLESLTRRILAAIVESLNHPEVVEASTLLQSPDSENPLSSMINGPYIFLPFRIKQDHTGVVGLIKFVGLYREVIGIVLSKAEDRGKLIENILEVLSSLTMTKEMNLFSDQSFPFFDGPDAWPLIKPLFAYIWRTLQESEFMLKQPSRMTFKSFKLMWESVHFILRKVVIESVVSLPVDQTDIMKDRYCTLVGIIFVPCIVGAITSVALLETLQSGYDQNGFVSCNQKFGSCDVILNTVLEGFFGMQTISSNALSPLINDSIVTASLTCARLGWRLVIPPTKGSYSFASSANDSITADSLSNSNNNLNSVHENLRLHGYNAFSSIFWNKNAFPFVQPEVAFERSIKLLSISVNTLTGTWNWSSSNASDSAFSPTASVQDEVIFTTYCKLVSTVLIPFIEFLFFNWSHVYSDHLPIIFELLDELQKNLICNHNRSSNKNGFNHESSKSNHQNNSRDDFLGNSNPHGFNYTETSAVVVSLCNLSMRALDLYHTNCPEAMVTCFSCMKMILSYLPVADVSTTVNQYFLSVTAIGVRHLRSTTEANYEIALASMVDFWMECVVTVHPGLTLLMKPPRQSPFEYIITLEYLAGRDGLLMMLDSLTYFSIAYGMEPSNKDSYSLNTHMSHGSEKRNYNQDMGNNHYSNNSRKNRWTKEKLEERDTWAKLYRLLTAVISPCIVGPLEHNGKLTITASQAYALLEMGRIDKVTHSFIHGLCGGASGSYREDVKTGLFTLFTAYGPDVATDSLHRVLNTRGADFMALIKLSDTIRQSLPQMLRMHAINGNVKSFKAALRIFVPHK